MNQNQNWLPLFLFICLTCITGVYWIGYDKPVFGIDDANIYFVYMRNFARGHGFVWNVGGERVEGFTSLLWTLAGSFFYWLLGTRFYLALFLLNWTLIYLTMYRLMIFVRSLNGQKELRIAPTDILIVVTLLVPLGFIEWSIMSLMEMGIWIFLITNLTIDICRYFLLRKLNLFGFSLMLALLMLTRPESIVWAPLFLITFFYGALFQYGIKKALMQVVYPLAAMSCTFIGVCVWRIYYFGYPLPNTYYAKVSSNFIGNLLQGLRYLQKYFYEYPHLAIIAALHLFFAVVLAKKILNKMAKHSIDYSDKVQITTLIFVLTGLMLPVFLGGDHFKFSRFYQACTPISLIGILNFRFWEKNIGYFVVLKRPVTLALILILSFGLFYMAKSTWFDFSSSRKITDDRVLRDFYYAKEGRTVAMKVNETFSTLDQKPGIGVIAAGGFGFAYQGNTIDLMGLNNTLMAHASKIKIGPPNHASFDTGAFWRLMPDMVGSFFGADIITDTLTFVLPENIPEFRKNTFAYKVYKRIYDSPHFIEKYKPALVRKISNPYYLFAYYNSSFLKRLDPDKYYVKLLARNDDF